MNHKGATITCLARNDMSFDSSQLLLVDKSDIRFVQKKTELSEKLISPKPIAINTAENEDAIRTDTIVAEESASASFKVIAIGNHRIRMKEFAAADYGLFIWPCSIVLGCYLHQNQRQLCSGLPCKSTGEQTSISRAVISVCGGGGRCPVNITRPNIHRPRHSGARLWHCPRRGSCSEVSGN